MAVLGGGEGRARMMVLVGGDDRRRHLRPRQQLLEIGGEEIRAAIGLQFLAELAIDVAEPDPADARKLLGDHRANAPDRSAADDGEPDVFSVASHPEPRLFFSCDSASGTRCEV